jgi:hypothetical protein
MFYFKKTKIYNENLYVDVFEKTHENLLKIFPKKISEQLEE